MAKIMQTPGCGLSTHPVRYRKGKNNEMRDKAANDAFTHTLFN
tara:strand:+ start:320 stop:448 length:129 start_codon:yes stop_codon:yes gene_type:complete